MYFNLKMKSSTLLLFAFMVLVMLLTITVPVFAAPETSAEIIFEDVTVSEGSSKGEAKVKVSVKGLNGDVSISQIHIKIDGELKFAGIDYADSLKNNENSFLPQPTIKSNEIICGVINANVPMSFNGDETELFILSFTGEEGKTVSLDIDKTQSYFLINDEEIPVSNVSGDKTLTASSNGNELKTVKIKLTFDKDTGFTATKQNGINIVLTDENDDAKGHKIPVVLEDDAHRDYTTPNPVYVVSVSVVENHSYTVEVSGVGFVTYSKSGETFTTNKFLEITPADFKAGDVNGDGEINNDDKTLCQQYISENTYSVAADFNRDQKVDNSDLSVFATNEPHKTAPAKMTKPSVVGGDNKISVSWTAPDNGGTAITGYTIKYGTSSTNLNQTAEITNTSVTSKEITNLSADTTYYVQIAAINEIGTGDYSEIANAKTNASGGAGAGGAGGGGGAGGNSGTTDTPENPTAPTTPTTPVTPSGTTKTFIDLGNYHWATESIYTLKAKGIISGISETEYAPANNIKRGDFILILTRMLSISDAFEENFTDVPTDSYYYNAIGSAKANGIASGDGVNFNPENSITRQDLITLAYRAFLTKGYITETEDMTVLDAFADKESIEDYALSPMASMVKAGIIQGSDGFVNPLGNATRAEVAVMCARLLALMN